MRFLSLTLRFLFTVCLAYPVALLWLGLHVRHRERLPLKGPAIITANHNSHLDLLTLLALFPIGSIQRVQPAAAADYFCRNKLLSWVSRNVIGIIPVVRGSRQKNSAAPDPLEECYRALEAGQILIIFPEGTRGEPEQLADMKCGIWHLAQRFPEVPVIPIYMRGLGKSMPRGSLVPIPVFVGVAIGHALSGKPEKAVFMASLKERFLQLQSLLSPKGEIEPS